VPSPATGRVVEVLVDVGSTVDVGTVLARIDVAATPGEAHVDEGPQTADRRPQGGGPAPPISPVVRRIAAEHDVDLAQVPGTGRLGRVT
jgi:pyruvate/2-oxoglutarate dehydrogenase complex dihydrolipoamide acyltransferase (E2) component